MKELAQAQVVNTAVLQQIGGRLGTSPVPPLSPGQPIYAADMHGGSVRSSHGARLVMMTHELQPCWSGRWISSLHQLTSLVPVSIYSRHLYAQQSHEDTSQYSWILSWCSCIIGLGVCFLVFKVSLTLPVCAVPPCSQLQSSKATILPSFRRHNQQPLWLLTPKQRPSQAQSTLPRPLLLLRLVQCSYICQQHQDKLCYSSPGKFKPGSSVTGPTCIP